MEGKYTMTGHTNCRNSTIAAGVVWTATIAGAVAEIEIRLYLLIWLATALISLIAFALWLFSPDRITLANVRTRLQQARLRAALMEEAANNPGRHPYDHDTFNPVA